MAPVDSRDYVLGGIYYSVLVRNTCQHSQQTRPGTLAQHQTSTGATPRVCTPTLYKCYTNILCLLGIAAGLILLNTADGDYKPTPTQGLLNAGPASPVLASMHSVLVRTSCCGYLHAGGTVTML